MPYSHEAYLRKRDSIRAAQARYKKTAKGSAARHARYVADRSRIRAQQADSALMRMYGLTRAAYNDMYAAQEGRCTLCGRSKRKLVVDHSHATGKVRSLLCRPCNTALGTFRDDPEVVEGAAAYLREHAK